MECLDSAGGDSGGFGAAEENVWAGSSEGMMRAVVRDRNREYGNGDRAGTGDGNWDSTRIVVGLGGENCSGSEVATDGAEIMDTFDRDERRGGERGH